MKFEDALNQGIVKKVPIDILRSKSLVKSSEQAIHTAKIIPLQETTLKTIFRELYEGLREYCEAIGFAKGYKFSDHESITSFLSEILNENAIALKFDRYRKLRNGINYYGNSIEENTAKEALKDIPDLISKLKPQIK
jgi:hypothetical protein